MKKTVTVLLVLVLLVSFAACGGQKLTMQNLVEANQTKTLLENHDSVYIHGTMDGELYADYYLTDTYAYEKHPTWSMYLTDGMGYAYEDGMYKRAVYLTRDGLVDFDDYWANQYADVILGQESLRGKIQSVTEAENQITVTSAIKEKDIEKIIGEESVRSYESTYVVDSETYSMITTRSTLTNDDGTTVDCLMECSYDEEMPEEIKPFLAYANQTEDLRTITVVFHVSTEQEKTEYVQAPKGHAILLMLPNGATAEENFSVYADAACTELYQSNGDYTSDVTVYIH